MSSAVAAMKEEEEKVAEAMMMVLNKIKRNKSRSRKIVR
jgi:hypothetical protein